MEKNENKIYPGKKEFEVPNKTDEELIEYITGGRKIAINQAKEIESLKEENKQLKEALEGKIKSECMSFFRWICNTNIAGRTMEKLWIDYKNQIE